MGRGRAKAKQVKVARRLKYNSSGDTDLERLRDELGVSQDSQDDQDPYDDDSSYDDLADRYADFAEGNDEKSDGKG